LISQIRAGSDENVKEEVEKSIRLLDDNDDIRRVHWDGANNATYKIFQTNKGWTESAPDGNFYTHQWTYNPNNPSK